MVVVVWFVLVVLLRFAGGLMVVVVRCFRALEHIWVSLPRVSGEMDLAYLFCFKKREASALEPWCMMK